MISALANVRHAVKNTKQVLKQHTASLSTSVTYGPGGRASAGPDTVTVFGATGQLGRYVVTELAKQGNTVIVPYRGDDMEWRHLKVTGDLGRVAPIPYNIRDEDSVRYCLQHSNKAVNLIGKHYETQHVFGDHRSVRLRGSLAKAHSTVLGFCCSARAQSANVNVYWPGWGLLFKAMVRCFCYRIT